MLKEGERGRGRRRGEGWRRGEREMEDRSKEGKEGVGGWDENEEKKEKI